MQVLDVATGQELALLSQGHYDAVTACAYSPITGHLWSTGLDGALLAWAPKTLPDAQPAQPAPHYLDSWLAAATAGRGRQQEQQRQGLASGGSSVAAAAAGSSGRAVLPDVDCWSDDEGLLVSGWDS